MSQDQSTIRSDEEKLQQIEYLLYQSTQGVHFMFNRQDILGVLSENADNENFFTYSNIGKIQGVLSKFLEKPTLTEKQIYLESLEEEEFKTLVRAYFHLVENTILANTKLKH